MARHRCIRASLWSVIVRAYQLPTVVSVEEDIGLDFKHAIRNLQVVRSRNPIRKDDVAVRELAGAQMSGIAHRQITDAIHFETDAGVKVCLPWKIMHLQLNSSPRKPFAVAERALDNDASWEQTGHVVTLRISQDWRYSIKTPDGDLTAALEVWHPNDMIVVIVCDYHCVDHVDSAISFQRINMGWQKSRAIAQRVCPGMRGT